MINFACSSVQYLNSSLNAAVCAPAISEPSQKTMVTSNNLNDLLF